MKSHLPLLFFKPYVDPHVFESQCFSTKQILSVFLFKLSDKKLLHFSVHYAILSSKSLN